MTFNLRVDDLKKECIVCYDENVDVLVMPCRHLCLGLECAKLIREKKDKRHCPMCRTDIVKFVRIQGL